MNEEVNEVGIETLKELVKGVVDLTEDVVQKAADGITVGEALSIAVGSLDDVYRLARKGGQIKMEWKDRTESEKAELVAYAIEELDQVPEHAEAIVEEALKLANQFDSTVTVIKAAIEAKREQEAE